jgi:hypothetical protein
MTSIEYQPGIRTVKYYIVEVKQMRESEISIKGEGGKKITLLLPDKRNNDTDGLAETGIVKSVPLGHSDKLLGKQIRFWFLNTDFTMKSGIEIEGHVLVPEYDIVQVEDKMYGDWVYCAPIRKKQGNIYLPTIQQISYDSMEQPEEQWSDHYIDKGFVARENEHYPIGTQLFWGNPANVRQKWDDGFLVRTRYIQAVGDDVSNINYIRN